ncbi:type II toxin-antitoxin system RelE/ParE family toxin [Mucilaginibacter sp. FT3.2]|uniref:type II toxin-antitoxin system RelE/ParE family toxin n=1 Tax=Mucilaginibacter sp. FT3.2 TaxID=2723090 RepID=UPI00160ED8D2|nr:type II toxin-antitoxin system RelE/ParE family toxin [Mucilaginibacter sp. FT3.2]MBB6234436.1 hypothetical protein [Mucilaginibacter sp. FT3.2]
MSFKVLTIVPFEKEFKHLAKKYPSIKKDLSELIAELGIEPNKGTPIGNGCYKIRLAISSKGKGKSGGARVITYFALKDNYVYLLSIYDKSEQSNISDKDILRLLDFTEE